MSETRKARVGLLGLMFELYDVLPELKPAMAEFAEALGCTMSSFAEVDFPGVCNTREQVARAVADFEADDKDLIMVVLLTYAPSHIALPALRRTRLPILVFNTQQLRAVTEATTSWETTENHGMHGVQDLANVLLRAEREFHLVTGHYRDNRTLTEVKSWCDAARTVSFLQDMGIGLIGYPMEGMGDFGVDQTALLSQVGVQVRHIAMKAVADRASAAPPDEISAQMDLDRQRFAGRGIRDLVLELLDWARERGVEPTTVGAVARERGYLGDQTGTV